MLKYKLHLRNVRHSVLLVITIFFLFVSLGSASGSVSYSLLKEPHVAVDSPPVALQAGTAGTSTIYTNETSAKVNVAAPVVTYDFVDNNVSDVDSSADKGTHSNFENQKAGPDSNYDTLTEADTGTKNQLVELWVNGFTSAETQWTRTGASPYLNAMDNPTNIVSTGTRNYAISRFGFSDLSSATTINSVQVCVYANTAGDDGAIIQLYNSTGGPYNIATQYFTSAYTWYNFTCTSTLPTLTEVNGAQLRLYSQRQGGTMSTVRVDASLLRVNYSITLFELDIEEQFTDCDYTKTNEELCIYVGSTGAEDMKVYAWYNNMWNSLFNDLNPNGWNNVSVTSYLVSSTFTIRFLGGTETSDTTQDSWDIDAALLHVWADQSYDYVLEVNNTVAVAWNIRLKAYDETSIDRLWNCTIYFHNGGGTSRQIYILNGVYDQQVGDWYALAAYSSDYIAVTVSATSTGASYVYVYLEILVPGTSTYTQYVITFEIT